MLPTTAAILVTPAVLFSQPGWSSVTYYYLKETAREMFAFSCHR